MKISASKNTIPAKFSKKLNENSIDVKDIKSIFWRYKRRCAILNIYATFIQGAISMQDRLAMIKLCVAKMQYVNMPKYVAVALFDRAFFIECLKRFDFYELKKRTGITKCILDVVVSYFKITILDYAHPALLAYKERMKRPFQMEMAEHLQKIKACVVKMSYNSIPIEIAKTLFEPAFFAKCIVSSSDRTLCEATAVGMTTLLRLKKEYGFEKRVAKSYFPAVCSYIEFVKAHPVKVAERLNLIKSITETFCFHSFSLEYTRYLFDRAFLVQCLSSFPLRALASKTNISIGNIVMLKNHYNIAVEEYDKDYHNCITEFAQKLFCLPHITMDERLALIRRYSYPVNKYGLSEAIYAIFFDRIFFLDCLSKMDLGELSAKTKIAEHLLVCLNTYYAKENSSVKKEILQMYKDRVKPDMSLTKRLELIGLCVDKMGGVTTSICSIKIFFDEGFLFACLKHVGLEGMKTLTHINKKLLTNLYKHYIRQHKYNTGIIKRVMDDYSSAIKSNLMMDWKERLVLVRKAVDSIKKPRWPLHLVRQLFDKEFLTECLQNISISGLHQKVNLTCEILSCLKAEYRITFYDCLPDNVKLYLQAVKYITHMTCAMRCTLIKWCLNTMPPGRRLQGLGSLFISRDFLIYCLYRMSLSTLSERTGMNLATITYIKNNIYKIKLQEYHPEYRAAIAEYNNFVALAPMNFEMRLTLIRKCITNVPSRQLSADILLTFFDKEFFMKCKDRFGLDLLSGIIGVRNNVLTMIDRIHNADDQSATIERRMQDIITTPAEITAPNRVDSVSMDEGGLHIPSDIYDL